MLKHVLLATSFAIAVPAMAQDAPNSPTMPQQEMQPAEPMTSPQPGTQCETQSTPDAAAPAAETAQTVPDSAASAQDATETAQQPAASEPTAASREQVAAVVTREFSTYDADANGALDKAEFSSWMGKLRAAAEPTYQPESAQAVAWNDKAFAQADVDKDAKVNQAELTTFLTPKAS